MDFFLEGSRDYVFENFDVLTGDGRFLEGDGCLFCSTCLSMDTPCSLLFS